jgi:Flp pilus assembly protein TadG
MFKLSKTSRSEKGQSLVELAISMVFVIMLLIGVVDFGLAFFSWVAIRDASQEGAIYGAICPNDENAIVTRVREASNTPVNLKNFDRTNIEVDIPSLQAGGPITVLVEFDYQSITPVASAVIGENGFLTLRASTTNTILTTTEPSCILP